MWYSDTATHCMDSVGLLSSLIFPSFPSFFMLYKDQARTFLKESSSIMHSDFLRVPGPLIFCNNIGLYICASFTFSSLTLKQTISVCYSTFERPSFSSTARITCSQTHLAINLYNQGPKVLVIAYIYEYIFPPYQAFNQLPHHPL